VPFIKGVKVGPSWSKVLLDILLFFQAVFVLSRDEYDVIHSHEEAAFWSVPLSKIFQTRHVYDMHSSLPQQLAGLRGWSFWPFVKLFEVLERWVINTCDAIITIGADLEEGVLQLNPRATTVLIQNLAIHTDDAGSSQTSARTLREKMGLDGKLPVVYTGNFEHYQGLALVLKSATIVKKQCPEVVFVMVGGDPQQVKRWEDRASACGLADSMLFTGSVPLTEAMAYLDLAEILVSPRTEHMSVPLKIYSYLRSGKPIVATDLAAHSQVLNDKMAVLVAPTEEAFAEGIMTLVQSPVLRKTLGLRGQQFARERFRPEDYLAKLDSVYQQPVSSARFRNRRLSHRNPTVPALGGGGDDSVSHGAGS
jgi:glycosyltransferase involved in cell wall biosynthesis